MNKVPKVIHYCWFGGKELPEEVRKNISSWKKFCPNFEIKEWNEKNFDLDCNNYVKEAYQAGKWAFVSDYVRFWVLYYYGGIYFDTDVELIKPMDKLIKAGPFMSREKEFYTKYKIELEKKILSKYTKLQINGRSLKLNFNDIEYSVNPGLGMCAYPKMQFFGDLLKIYNNSHFILKDNSYNPATVVDYTTVLAKMNGLETKEDKNGQIIIGNEKIKIYATDVLDPIDYNTFNKKITDNTVAIHHYSASWLTYSQKIEMNISNFLIDHGIKNQKLIRINTLPIRVIGKISTIGFRQTLKLIVDKFKS